MTQTTQVRFRSIALPVEHGGWGFLLEPMLAGLLVAPSWAGVWVCVAALAVFSLHQPLKVALKESASHRAYARTRWAWRFALLYGAVALLGFGLALVTASGPFWLPLIAAAPLALVQILYETRNRGRDLLPEALGAIALGATAPAILLAGGQPLPVALLVWLLLGLRTLPALLYVRAVLRRQRQADIPAWPVVSAHLAALAVADVVTVAGAASPLLIVAMLLLLLRAVFGLYRRGTVQARVVGLWEMAFGLISTCLIAAALL